MPKNLKEVGTFGLPETIWTLSVEKVKNEKGREEYIISIPEKLRKHLKLKEGDKLFWGECANNCCEVKKAKKEHLQYLKIDLGQDNAMRQARMNQHYTP